MNKQEALLALAARRTIRGRTLLHKSAAELLNAEQNRNNDPIKNISLHKREWKQNQKNKNQTQ